MINLWLSLSNSRMTKFCLSDTENSNSKWQTSGCQTQRTVSDKPLAAIQREQWQWMTNLWLSDTENSNSKWQTSGHSPWQHGFPPVTWWALTVVHCCLQLLIASEIHHCCWHGHDSEGKRNEWKYTVHIYIHYNFTEGKRNEWKYTMHILYIIFITTSLKRYHID